jgi:hypothetical protein
LEKVVLRGDLQDDSGSDVVETLELWYRDPVDCIRELMGNPAFRNVMQYAPQKVFEDAEGRSEVIDEMWTAAWWWKLQVSAKGKCCAANTHGIHRNSFLQARQLLQ